MGQFLVRIVSSGSSMGYCSALNEGLAMRKRLVNEITHFSPQVFHIRCWPLFSHKEPPADTSTLTLKIMSLWNFTSGLLFLNAWWFGRFRTCISHIGNTNG